MRKKRRKMRGELFSSMDYFFCSAMCLGAGWKRENFGNPLFM
jgi:hypothetical protein